ncbi:MAG: rhamnan synthesis F family protein, partial [Candidatus Gastranaerophilaceae bacterium]
IFVSDSDVTDKELEKISQLVCSSLVGRHGEYDFGSYKRGFQYALSNKLLENCEELVFCNDSCYGPLYSFDNVFNKMDAVDCDFWGITYNPIGVEKDDINQLYEDNSPHVQSFFFVFKPQVFNSQVFIDFITNVKKEENKYLIVINYEIGLSKLLYNNGFKSSFYCQYSQKCNNASWFHPKKLFLHDKCPLIKTSIFRSERKITNLLKLINKYTDYDIELIKKDLKYNTYRKKLSLFEWIFSIKNDEGKRHKVITICGFKIAIRRKV